MVHLLTPAPTTAATALSTRAWKSSLYSWKNGCFPTPSQYQRQMSSISDQNQATAPCNDQPLCRRAMMGLSGALVVLGLSLSDKQISASAAGRPPPPPPKEKKDPNVSGVQAKVLANKRRKKAMKEEVARLIEKGKAINKEPSPASG